MKEGEEGTEAGMGVGCITDSLWTGSCGGEGGGGRDRGGGRVYNIKSIDR